VSCAGCVFEAFSYSGMSQGVQPANTAPSTANTTGFCRHGIPETLFVRAGVPSVRLHSMLLHEFCAGGDAAVSLPVGPSIPVCWWVLWCSAGCLPSVTSLTYLRGRFVNLIVCWWCCLLGHTGLGNTVSVPRHWSQKRKYLQGKRGIERPPFGLPDFIEATGRG